MILCADLVLRTEMFRTNTTHPTLTGDEVLESVWPSAHGCDPLVATYTHAEQLPSHQALVESNRRTYVPTTMPKSVTPRKIESGGEICRRFADGRCQWLYANPTVRIPTHWGDACKRVHDRRARNPSPGLKARMGNERNQRKRRRTDRAPTFALPRSLGHLTLTPTPSGRTGRMVDCWCPSTRKSHIRTDNPTQPHPTLRHHSKTGGSGRAINTSAETTSTIGIHTMEAIEAGTTTTSTKVLPGFLAELTKYLEHAQVLVPPFLVGAPR